MAAMNRRPFLIRGGASLAGAVVASSFADSLRAATRAGSMPHRTTAIPHHPATGPGFPGGLLDELSAIVADLETKFPYASALFIATGGVSISRDRKGKRVSEAGTPTLGASIRIFDGGAFHETAVGSTSPQALHAAAAALKRSVPRAADRYRIERLPQLQQTWHTAMERDPAALPLKDRAALLDQEFDRCNWDDPRVRGVRVSTDVTETQRVFVDRTRRLASVSTMVAHTGFMFGFDKGKPGFGFRRHVGQAGLELAHLNDTDIEKLRKDFVESLTAEPVPAGEYEVVFAPEVSGLLAHESFGHGVEMDQFVKDRAKSREFLNKPVASKLVTLLDDPSFAGARGSYAFDDEGATAQPTTIIKDGIFVQPLTDLMSATFLRTSRTPNGRTQSWDRKVYARMSNTFFARGTSDPQEMLDSLKDGLYLEGFRNGIEDPQGWGIQFTAGTAREVKNGKFTGRIFAPPTITGYVPEILGNITMVGNDFALEPGSCGKGFKEFVAVTSGGPHLRTKAKVS